MTHKAFVTLRKTPGVEAEALNTGDQARAKGFAVEHDVSNGSIINLDHEGQVAELEHSGFRVKVLPNTNLLQVGSYEIDTESATEAHLTAEHTPPIPPELEIPAAVANRWRHYLVQLIGPPTEEWIRLIEERGVDVVEPISAYGLFVVAPPELVNQLRDMPFVAWVGAFKPAYRIASNLRGLTGLIEYLSIAIYPPDEVKRVKTTLTQVGATVVRETPPVEGYHDDFARLIVKAEASAIPTLARLPGVRSIEYASSQPGLDGERETQIVAENLNGATGALLAPIPGYRAWLESVELTGADVVIAICDTGVSNNAANNTTGHEDLRGRQLAFVDYSSGTSNKDTNGHGTHVAGIAVGNAATGKKESNFLRGQGMAPGANYVVQNALEGPWPPTEWGALTRDAVRNQANVMNNSWWDGGPAGSGYTQNSRRFDQLVRDPDVDTAELDQLIVVFSAGNAGPAPNTITPPKEAKNPISVGNSLALRPSGEPDDIRGISRTSSRGPARDGRLLPNIVAPGTNVSSAKAGTTEE